MNRYWPTKIFIGILILIALTASIHGAKISKEQLQAFRTAKSVNILVKQQGGGVQLPFNSITGKLLQYAGLNLQSSEDIHFDLTLEIEAFLTAKGAHYGKYGNKEEPLLAPFFYTGATVEGVFWLEVQGLSPYGESFYGDIPVPEKIQIKTQKESPLAWTGPRTPAAAPFAEAFYERGSFGSTFAEFVGKVWGPVPLAAALRDSDSGVRKVAALMKIDPECEKSESARASVPHLVAALATEYEEVQWVALNALKDLGDSTAVEPLMAIINNTNISADKRNAAAEALGEIGDRKAVEPLIMMLRRKGEIPWAAANALGKICDRRAVEPIIAELKDEQNWDRKRALIRPLGKFGDKKALEPLIAALRDKSEPVREEAAKALGELGDMKAAEPLITALMDMESNVRANAATALGMLKDGRAIEPLISALKDEDNDVKREAAIALGKLGDSRALAPLIAALLDLDWVRETILEALSKINPNWARSEEAQVAFPSFIDALLKGERWVREAAAVALGQFGDKRASGPLIEALRDEDSDVRKAAAKALEKIDSEWRTSEVAKAAVPVFIAALKDEDWDKRNWAANMLGDLGDSRAVEHLITALTSALNAISTDSLYGKNLYRGFHKTAAKALKQLGDSKAVKILLASTRQLNPDVKEAAVEALAELGDSKAVEPLIAFLSDKNLIPYPEVRKLSAWALGQIGDNRAVGPLIDALQDEDLRSAAARALEKITGQNFGPYHTAWKRWYDWCKTKNGRPSNY